MICAFKNKKCEAKVLASYDDLLKKWDCEFREDDVDTTFGKTHIITGGNEKNPPLLMFHGVGDNSAVMWLLNFKELSKHFYCIAVDTLGGPGKSVPNENYIKGQFKQREWINDLADKLKLDKFSIVGVSNGAVMAFNYAVAERERVEKVICIEGGMIIKPGLASLRMVLRLFPEILIPTRNNLIKIIKKLGVSPETDIFDVHPEILEHILSVMKSHNQKAMFLHKHDKYNKQSTAEILDKFYFLIGGYGTGRSTAFLEILKNDGFKYKLVKNAGHGLNMEQPELVNSEIIDFLLYNKNNQ